MNEFNCIKKNIIYNDKYLREFFESIDKKMNNRKWYMDRAYGKCNCLGYTIEDENYIYITLALSDLGLSEFNESVNDDNKMATQKLKAVLIHELGEADYILSKMPMIEKIDEPPDIISNLKEIFTHNHIKCLLKKYDVLYKLTYSNLVCEYRVNEEITNWKKIIRTCWLLTTYPALEKSQINYINEIDESVDNDIDYIMEIVNNIDTLNQSEDNIVSIKNNMEKIVKILENNGMTYTININNP